MGQREGSRTRPTVDQAAGQAQPNGGTPVDGLPTHLPATTEVPPSSEGAETSSPIAAPGINPVGPPPGRIRITFEGALWLLLIAAAFITRFWNLGSRALHHDETIHTYYSWGLYTGEVPYVHNPLSHGPFLFHANALVYLLLGASDASSRYLPALAGVILVALPWLLRGQRFLGRWGALAASFMLLISPAFLYYTRYIRHDPYTAVGSVVVLIAIFRYLERPQRRWLVTAFVATAFLLTNHEIVFAIGLAFVVSLWGALLWGRLRPLVPVHLLFVGLGVGLLVVRRITDWGPLPLIPWRTPTPQATREYYGDLLSHPVVQLALALGVGFVVACVWAIRHATRNDEGEGWFETLFADAPPGSVAAGVYHAGQDRVGLFAGFMAALAIFIGLFTTLLTNFNGLATATFAPNGTLLYWLGQQDVQRGEQPWFYFITEAPQYEWLAIVFGLAGVVLTGGRVLRALRGGDPGANLFLHIFLSVWFGLIFLVLSWAGEKMPWLILHIVLPAILLGAATIGEIVDRARAWYRASTPRLTAVRRTRLLGPALVGALVLTAGAWFLLAARLTWAPWGEESGDDYPRAVRPEALDNWWSLALPPLAAVVLVGVGVWIAGTRRAAYATLTAAFIVMSLFQVHAGFRLAFVEGDIARDTLIYNTTSPDVPQLVADLDQLSAVTTGGDDMVVAYDNCTEWPLIWYLRDFDNRQKFSSGPPVEEQPPVIMGVPTEWQPTDCPSGLDTEIAGYTAQTYVLRWHEPEGAIYRNFAIAPEIPVTRSALKRASDPNGPSAIAGSIASSFGTLTTPEGEQRVFRLLMYRELPVGLNGYRFRVYVRNDLLPLYNEIRYGA